MVLAVARKYTIEQLRSAWGAGVYHGQKTIQNPVNIDYQKEFAKLSEIEPRLKRLEELAKAFRLVCDNWVFNWPHQQRPPRPPDAEYFWHHVLKQMMFPLVGCSRTKDLPEISDSDHWDISYTYLCKVLFGET